MSGRPLSTSVLGLAIVAITGMQLMSTLDGTIVIVALVCGVADDQYTLIDARAVQHTREAVEAGEL